MSLASLKAKLHFRRYLDLLLGAAFLVTLILVVLTVVKVSRGVTRTVKTPEHLVRLQVLNAAGVNNLESKMAGYLEGFKDADLEIKVVDRSEFDLRKVSHSFVINRDNDKKGAELLARTLGLDPSEIVSRPLANNVHQVSATLVLGEDYQNVKLPPKPTKE